MPFQAITRSSKSRKNEIFPKGFKPRFLAKTGEFSNYFFLGNIGKNDRFSNFFFVAIQGRKMSFMIIYNVKTRFQAIKTRSSKRRKNGHFSNFFFYAMQTTKMYSMIFQNVKTPLQAIKTRSSKSRKNGHFSKGVNPWFWSKNGHFSNFFFCRNIGQENVFYDIVKRKNAFLGYKNKKFNKLKS